MTAARPAAALIREAQLHDRDSIVALLTAAYSSGLVAAWLIPEPERRPAALKRYGLMLHDHGLTRAVAHVSEDQRAAAVWYPFPTHNTNREAEDDAAAVTATLGPGPAARLELLCDVLIGLRPTTPHHELGHLGVHPDHQGCGLASALLRHHHAVLDTTGIPAYAVATSRNVRDFYGWHGYSVRERVTVPGGPTLWATSRDPLRINPARPDSTAPSGTLPALVSANSWTSARAWPPSAWFTRSLNTEPRMPAS